MIKEQVINGWPCEVTTDDETGFVYVCVLPTEENGHRREAIVRGEVPETAMRTAAKAIEHLKRGDLLLHHDPEGIIKVLPGWREQVEGAMRKRPR